MFENFFSRFSSAISLPPVKVGKAPTTPQAAPGYRRNVEASKSRLPETDRQLVSTDRLLTARNLSTTKKVVRNLAHSSPELSSAISSMLRVGIPERYTVIARDAEGLLDEDATRLANGLLRRLTYLGNVDGSYGAQQTLQSLSEQLGLELLIEGAMALEVALDKARVPASMNPVAVSTLKAYEEENYTRWVQVVGGVETSLDIPTFIYTAVDQDLLEPYSASFMEAAIQPVLADLDFNNDTRRALKRAVLPRLTATIDSEKVKKMTPPEILADAVKFTAYKQAIVDEVSTVINGLSPEDALVSFDSLSYGFIDGGKDPSVIIQRIQETLNAKLASGAKTLPVVLGHATTSNASSTEAMLFLKNANIIRVKLNEVYSRALTIAVRLMGIDGYVEFNYEHLDLRPAKELEAYRAMEQSRITELLSLGMLTDAEACIALTGNLPPAGYKPLSGTMFKVGVNTITNPGSNTSAISQTTTPKTPKAPKSADRGDGVEAT